MPGSYPRAGRKLQPEGPLWTFWDYERNRWPLDKGMRLDHFLLSPALCERLVDGGVDRWVRGEENASDHAPAWIVLGSPGRRMPLLPFASPKRQDPL
jgi:exodeoxyribonuclease-3